MPSTVYKGDLAEVSFAPETGMIIRDNTDVSIAVANSGNITTITFSSQNNSALFDSSAKLKYPKNMLVGSQLVFKAASSSTINAGDLPDTGNGGRIFTIVENNGTTIKITPAMVTSAGGSVNFSNNDSIIILPYKTPPMDVAMTHTTAGESVKTDQFLGIATALTLPETKVDLKRFHVVGLGRDVSIQVPGKLINEGGSFEVAMHSARWLKYCLGHELINSPDNGSVATALSSASLAGQSHIIVASKSGIAVDDYIEIRDDAPIVPVVSSHEPDGGTWDGTLTDFEFDNAKPHEVRRVIGVSSVDTTLYLDEPLLYPHAASTDVEVRDPDTTGSLPVMVTSAGVITNPVEKLLFSRSTQPSFALEVSQRRRDMDSDESTVDGGVGDTKELTRIFRGCKVTDFTMTTDNDAALRLSVNFNAALCYTDTGRLESPAITRYSSHRMFDDTANTAQGRINSGIALGTQKPFMFYNGSITLAGQQVAQVMNFSLTGQTGMQAFHTINGHYQSSSASTDQVPFAGARNANLMVEGQTSYEMTMEIGVEDPLFYHKMRTGTEFSVNGEGGSTTNQIRIIFEKNLTGEKMVMLIDDYYIIEAPLQIPEDKGVVKSTLKIMPKSIKVLASDAVPKY
tara:strand:- start:55 stop:1935 length:1881 start_codon:yes stop_codon:yes gene_type:complete